MRNAPRISALVALIVLAGCFGPNLDTVWDTQFDFDSLDTFDWAPKEPETGADLDYGSLDTAIKELVDRHMTRVGFRRSGDNPSFLLTYYIGVEEVTQIQQAYYGRGWGGYWGWGWFGSAGINASQYDVGTVTIDVLSPDPAIGLVWRGIARAELQPAPPGAGRLEDAIREVLETFPPEDER